MGVKNKINIDNKEVNFDVLNALSLHHPSLGEAYLKFDWNPLGEDFRLDISFLERYLEYARYKNPSKMPAFLEQDKKGILNAFKKALENNEQLIAELKSRLENGEFFSYKDTNITKQVEEIVFLLKCRSKMLEISLGQIRVNGIDPFKAYENIRGINRRLSQLLEEAYTEEYNKKMAIANMIDFAMQNKNLSYEFTPFIKSMFNPFAAFNQNKTQDQENLEDGFIKTIDDHLKNLNKLFENVGINLNAFRDSVMQSDFSQALDNVPPPTPQNHHNHSHGHNRNHDGPNFTM